jgi:hypothetical protein
MSEDYLAQQQPTLTWNSVRGVWEKAGMANLLCEHWELFSATWQTSGMMRNGQVFELPTLAHPTTDSEFSSLPTPTAIQSRNATSGRQEGSRHHAGTTLHDLVFDGTIKSISHDGLLRTPTASQGEGGALGEEEARKRGNTVGIRDNAMDIARLNGQKVSRVSDNLLPTPVASEGTKAPAQQTSEVKGKTGQVWLSNVAKDMEPALPTPTASDWKGANHSGSGSASTRGMATVVEQTNWGNSNLQLDAGKKHLADLHLHQLSQTAKTAHTGYLARLPSG